MPQTLEQKISAYIELGNALPEVPLDLKNNLNPAFELRPYQNQAFSRFLYYLSNDRLRQKPAQLLFHMATGSGKTLIMAGAILHLYKQGYRNFLFFVNSTNIINKTRENFLTPLSSKYLFAETIAFGDKKVAIKEVDNFQAANEEDINIAFSTIQGLHSRLNTPRENCITYDDFQDKKIVLISDEAHHINVETKKGKLNKEEQEEIISWEGTVSRIFRSNPENILLEYTATADFSVQEIASKYCDKILCDYPLKQFRIDGYSKEVKVLQSDVPLIQRALHALILSQYRRKVFEKNRKRIKPVILFKSKTIAESKSFYDEFAMTIKNLKKSDISAIEKSDEPTLKRCFVYFKENNISIENLIEELKNDFSEEKCIEVNSKEESEEKQIAVNTLENENNEYCAVFAVDKLNEGWDVLNLFDIVRLYDTRDAKEGKPGNTTMSEAQLIGRGARYCPFQIDQAEPKFQRKYDSDIQNELRICEELYYHSAYNPRYIQELNIALQEIGIKAKETKEIQLELKMDFKESDFYKNGLIFLNKQVKYDRSGLSALPNIVRERIFHVNLFSGAVESTAIFDNAASPSKKTKQRDYMLEDFGFYVIKKAISKLEFYRFHNLKSFLPNVKSIHEFISSENYLKKIRVEVEGEEGHIAALTPNEKLKITVSILDKISQSLESDKVEYQGTPEFFPNSVSKIFSKDKTLNIFVKEGSDQEYGVPQSQASNNALRLDLSSKEWYAFKENYGTSEEKYLIKFIDKAYDALKLKWDEIFLVRNERHFQIYTFNDGQPIEPDFVLFLKKKDSDLSLHYQIFIEPKGEHLLKYDEWKEKFLKSLKEQHRINVLWKSKKYTVWGMPFYNEALKKTEFENEFRASFL
ncbi:MAG: DEAD/DEAH box helicase family protein [Thermodesulfovibrionales bacterium]|nr:DEAD/DEAH box helicase family protein [Nitrospinota bacterium]MCG2710674.1 DEAD/DEAH box helicase family protein [Thermodesulfovibrionales bacterium]